MNNAPFSSIVIPSGGFRDLIAYKKSDVIVEGTTLFCARFLPTHGDRTVDQMNQAARSCKQNIAEGSSASGTSKETELKLTGVARATLDELAEDYLDYLKKHELHELPKDSERKAAMRAWCAEHNDWADYLKAFKERDAETLCNLMLTVIFQEKHLLSQMIARQEEDFRQNGDIHDRLIRARKGSLVASLESAIQASFEETKSEQELEASIASLQDCIQRKAWWIRKKRGWFKSS